MAALRAGLPVTKKSCFFVYCRRAIHDHHHAWHGDRGGPSNFCIPLTFFGPISSFAAIGAIENLWGKCPTAENAYNLGVCPSIVTKLKT